MQNPMKLDNANTGLPPIRFTTRQNPNITMTMSCPFTSDRNRCAFIDMVTIQNMNSVHATINPQKGPTEARTNPKTPPEKGRAEDISAMHKQRQKIPDAEKKTLNQRTSRP